MCRIQFVALGPKDRQKQEVEDRKQQQEDEKKKQAEVPWDSIPPHHIVPSWPIPPDREPDDQS